MSVSFARPDVSDLVFHLYARSIHPELFENHAECEIHHQAYSAVVCICDAGHAVSFRYGDRTITEVTTTREHPLPQRKRFLRSALKGSHHQTVTFDGGLSYYVSYQLEQLDTEVFVKFHQELLIDCQTADLAHQFPAGNRFCPAPLSCIQTHPKPNSLLIHAFHTFPENRAVVKTQSLFEF